MGPSQIDRVVWKGLEKLTVKRRLKGEKELGKNFSKCLRRERT